MQHSPRWKVVITDYNYADLNIERTVLTQWDAQVVPAQCATPEQVAEVGEEADALISQYAPITKGVIVSLSRCKVLGRYGIGVDNIDVEAATESGIAVVSVPSYCEDEVSDHALAMLLSWARRIPHYAAEIRGQTWDWKSGCPIYRLQGKVLGLLGFGKIARTLASKAKAIGFQMIAHDPYLPPEIFTREGVASVSFDELLSQSDFLSLHIPLTPKTRHLIDANALAKMKLTACLINTSRGAVVNEGALTKALQSGWLAGACLDVMETEPPCESNPLLTMDQVLLSPHVGWYSEESQVDLRRKLAENIGRALSGLLPDGLVNREVEGQFRDSTA